MRCVRTIKAHEGWWGGIEFSPDGSTVLTTGDNKVIVWNARTGAKIREKQLESESGVNTALLGTGVELLCVNRETMWVVDGSTFREKRTLCAPVYQNSPVFCCTRDGKTIFRALWNDCQRLDAQSGKQVWSQNIPGNQPYLSKMAVSPSGRRVAVAYKDIEHCLSVREGATGKELYRIRNRKERAPETIMGVAFTPDGRYLAACFRMIDGVRVWDAASGELCRELAWKARPVDWGHGRKLPKRGSYTLALSPDGRSCAVGCSDGLVRVFEVATGGLRGQVEVQAGNIAFSPDGRLLATGGTGEGVLRFWDLRDTGEGSTRKIEPHEVTDLWDDLGSEDARIGWSSILRLENNPVQALDILRRLRCFPPVPPKRIARLIERLDDDEFESREEATRELESVGVVAETALRREAEHTKSKESGFRVAKLLDKLARFQKDRVRHSRGVEILEAIGTAEAKKILADLAGGQAGLHETEDARAALARLNARSK